MVKRITITGRDKIINNKLQTIEFEKAREFMKRNGYVERSFNMGFKPDNPDARIVKFRIVAEKDCR